MRGRACSCVCFAGVCAGAARAIVSTDVGDTHPAGQGEGGECWPSAPGVGGPEDPPGLPGFVSTQPPTPLQGASPAPSATPPGVPGVS